MSSPAAPTLKRWVLTGSVAAITATGAWYGAGLKTQQEYRQERAKILEATPEQKIEHLELAKGRLVQQRNELQKKLDRLSSNESPNSSSSAT